MFLLFCVLAAGEPGPVAAAPEPSPAGVSAPPTGAMVKGITVTAERPRVQTLIDRRVYTVGTDLQATTGAATDVLANIPSVEVDADGNVTLRGDGSVTILIDGKPSAAFQGAMRGLSLQQLPASQIDRIEVLTSPPAQYRAEGSGGVINIVTKKAQRPGITGGAQLSTGDKRRFVASANAAYVRGPLKLSGAIGLRQEARQRLTSDQRTVLDPAFGAATASSQNTDERFRRFIPSGRAELEYRLNDRQTLTASVNRRDLTGDRFFDQDNASGPLGGPPVSISRRHSDGHEWSAEGDAGVRFEQKLSHPDETLSLSFNRSAEHEREGYAYTNTFSLPARGPSFDHLHLSHDLVKSEAGLDYALPLGDDRNLKAGLDLEEDRNRFDNAGDSVDPLTGALIVNPNLTYDYRFLQLIWAAYAQAQTAIGPWRLQSGVRYEHTQTWSHQLSSPAIDRRGYAGVYPSLNLERDLDPDTRVMFSVSRRLNRPDPEILNPFVDHQDIHNLRAGNPNLRPEDITGVEAGWTRSADGATRGVTAYYRLYRDSITNVITPVGPDVVLSTVANLPKRRAAGLELQATGKLWRTLGYSVSANAFWQEIDAAGLGAPSPGAPGLRSSTGVNGKASLDWRPTGTDTAQISISRSDRRLTPQGYVAAINTANLGYRRQLTKSWAAVVTVSDAFDGQRQRRVTTSPNLDDVYLRHQLGRVAYIGLSWNFSGQAKPKGQGFEYEQ